jgi:cellulose synthase/poly-beta-1,6-N-acetylglucosamine synthase-like glycosyltransferase
MITALQILFVLSAVVTSLGFVFVYQGWRRALRIPPQAGARDEVTVIIAAHNEARRIPRLLDALRAQSHPKERVRVIVVDDRSGDDTAAVARAHGRDLQLTMLRVDEVPDGVSPKKFALHRGIAAAETDIVLCTDADCEPETDWIGAMLRSFDRGSDVVTGLAPLRAGASASSRYAAFESRRSMALMTAAAAWGVPYMATGRSWGFRRDVYNSCGGLASLYAHLGGDDDLLLQRMVAAGARVGCCVEPAAQVLSPAPESWRALYRQKLRHYRVGTDYRGRGAMLLGLLLGAELMTLLSGVALLAVLPGLQKLLPLLLMLWTVWYASGFMVAPFKWMRGDYGRVTLAKWEGFHIFYSVIVSLLSHFRPSRW